jgi:hypothetical protein
VTVGGGHQRAGGKPGAPRKGLASNHVKRRPQESSQPAQGQSRPSTRGQYQTCRAFHVNCISYYFWQVSNYGSGSHIYLFGQKSPVELRLAVGPPGGSEYIFWSFCNISVCTTNSFVIGVFSVFMLRTDRTRGH